jgi:hypothetical protein
MCASKNFGGYRPNRGAKMDWRCRTVRTARKDKQPEILRSCFDCDHYAACRAQNGYPLAEKNANRCALYAERSLLTQERERNIQIQDELNKDIVMLMAELEQVKRERDAAVEDMAGICRKHNVCDGCKNDDAAYIPNDCIDCANACNWQWRGVKEAEHEP